MSEPPSMYFHCDLEYVGSEPRRFDVSWGRKRLKMAVTYEALEAMASGLVCARDTEALFREMEETVLRATRRLLGNHDLLRNHNLLGNHDEAAEDVIYITQSNWRKGRNVPLIVSRVAIAEGVNRTC